MQVELRQLKFGHEAPVHPSNARIGGRLAGIEALAANIHARGLIEDLIVFDDGVPDTWFVSDGNRCLAALRLIYGEHSTQIIDCKPREAEGAFEDSLAVAVLGHKLHPIDEFEGFTRLLEAGKTHEEVARQYGLTEKEVLQALALGGDLSPKARDMWRGGAIKAEVAKALTLSPDHAAQDRILEKLIAECIEEERSTLDLDGHEIKNELKLGADAVGRMVEFVGIDAYVARGGKVTRDLFGTDHKVSDAKLAKAMAAEKLAEECKALIALGWSFAVTKESVRNKSYSYGTLKVEAAPEPEEQKRLDELQAVFDPAGNFGDYDGPTFGDLTGAQVAAFLAHRELEDAIARRAYPVKLMAKGGCLVGIDDAGMLEIEYGRVKPAQKEAAAQETRAVKRETTKATATAAVAAGKPAPESTVLSNALKGRLESQLISATRDAIAGDPLLPMSPFAEVMAKMICAQIDPNGSWRMPDAVRTKLPSIRQTLNAGVFNAAIAKRFEAEDYFSSAPKGLVLKAIAEAINPDEARKVAKKTKAEIWKFALGNLGKTGWLPKELRTVHYAGPGSDGYARPPAAPAGTPEPERKLTVPTSAQSAATRHARAKPPSKAPVKRAASAKKPVKKTSAKKPAAKKKKN